MHAKIIQKGDHDARQLLLRLGMGNYNATISIQYMFMPPSATDPAMPSIILMTRHLQQGLRAAGAPVAVTGELDGPTVRCLIKLVGPDWNHVTWYALYESVLEAKRRRTLIKSEPMDLGMVPSLSAIPGGALTWAAAAVAAILLLKKRR